MSKQDLESSLRAILQEKLDGISGPSRPTKSVLVRSRIRRAAFSSAIVVGAGALAVGLLVGPSLYMRGSPDSNQQANRGLTLQPAQQSTPSPTPSPYPTSPDVKTSPSSPTVEIASGNSEGLPWKLEAYVGKVSSIEGTGDALCMNWQSGDRSTGFDCYRGLHEGPPEGQEFYFTRFTGRVQQSIVFVVADPKVETMTIELVDGGARPLELHPTPKELGVDLKFFVGFGDKGSDRAIVAKDQAGATIERQEVTPASP